MMYVKHKLEIDLSGQAVMPRVDMVEGDQYARQLELSLLCGGESWEIPEDVHAAVRFRKPDGTGGEYDSLPDGSPAWSASGNVLTVELAPQVLSCPGNGILSVVLTQGDARVSTFHILFQVHGAIPGGLESEDYFCYDGLLNAVSALWGAKAVSFLSVPAYFPSIIVWSGIWQTIGWNSIIYLAAISGINQELYESAVLDGANRFQKAIHITLPCISSTIIILLIFAVGGIVGNDSTKILLMYSPLTYKTSDVISTYVYREGVLGGSYSYTTAINLFNSVISLFFLLTTNFIARRISDSSIF